MLLYHNNIMEGRIREKIKVNSDCIFTLLNIFYRTQKYSFMNGKQASRGFCMTIHV
jgi:hypothetical protein